MEKIQTDFNCTIMSIQISNIVSHYKIIDKLPTFSEQVPILQDQVLNISGQVGEFIGKEKWLVKQ